MAWLGLIETGCILIREKHKHLFKMSDKVYRNVLEHKRSRIESRECFIEEYIDKGSIFVIVLYDNEITSLIDIYFLRISFIPSDPFRYFTYVTYSIDK
jgi:hypothetical protein